MRYLSAGESHGPCLTAIIEGLPAGLELSAALINKHLKRRQQGYGRGGRMAIESDRVEILSGLRHNRAIGSPLTLQIQNRDWENWQEIMAPEGEPPADNRAVTRPRPGHADLAGGLKYDHHDLRLVLERSSARETAIRVAVGSVARIFLEHFKILIYSRVIAIGGVEAFYGDDDPARYKETVEVSPLRCADPEAEKKMLEAIEKAKEKGDTLGGVFEVSVTGLPPGLGSHVQPDRRLDGRLCGALASIQAIKGVEVGAGFNAAALPGSAVHDALALEKDMGIYRSTNRAGGLEGGITNGEKLILRAAMKPIPTLARALDSVDLAARANAPGAFERSDVCAVPAAAVVAEAAVAWELAVAFREKFGGDFMEEIEASFRFYTGRIKSRLLQEGD